MWKWLASNISVKGDGHIEHSGQFVRLHRLHKVCTFHCVMCHPVSGGFSPQYLGAWAPPDGVRGSASLLGGPGGRALSGVQRQSPWSRGQGTKPPSSWSTFGFWTFNESRKVVRFSKIWKGKKKIKKIIIFEKKSWVATKLGGLCPPFLRPGPKTATAHSTNEQQSF